jgi:hypothetical protein
MARRRAGEGQAIVKRRAGDGQKMVWRRSGEGHSKYRRRLYSKVRRRPLKGQEKATQR